MKTQRFTHRTYLQHALILPVLFAVLFLLSIPFSSLAQTSSREPVEEAGNEPAYADGCKELLRAVKESDSVRVVELLRTVKPDCIYRGDGEAHSPLVAAVRNGDLFIVKLLMEAGADVPFHAAGDETPLMAAAANGHLDVARFLVDKGAAVNKVLTGEGTALLIASREGQLETVKYLISQGSDINAQVSGDGTPLINAVKNGHIEVARVLLEKGADPGLASPGDENPIFHARKSKDSAMIALLAKHEKGINNPLQKDSHN